MHFFSQNLFAQEFESNEIQFDGNEIEVNDLLLLCENAFVENLYDSAYNCSIKAKQLNSNYVNNKLKGHVAYWFAKSLYTLDQFENSENEFLVAIDYSVKANDTLQLALSYNELGRLYRKTANYSKALQAFNNASKFYYLLGDTKGIAIVNLNVGNVLKNIGRNELAKKKYWQALHVFKSNGDEFNEAGCYNNLGNIYKNEQKFDSAFYYMYKTLQIREKDSSKLVLAFIYHNLANLHLAVEDADSALFYIDKSLSINKSIFAYSDIASDYNVLGAIYIELEDWNRAIEFLDQALKINEQNNIIEQKLEILKQLAFAHNKIGNYKVSSDRYLEYEHLSDSLREFNENSSIENELINYELFADSIKTQHLLLEKDLIVSRKENAALNSRITIRNFTYAFVILFLIALIIVVFYLSARKRLTQTREHQAVLRVQNDELKRTRISKEEKEILLKEVHHRVKNNLQIINSLIRLQSNFMNAKNFKEKLTQIENRIRSMALIHEKLYKTGNLASLSVRHYIEELSFNIIESYENHNVKIKLKFDLEEREFGIDTLIPLGLIINEAIANSLKHAFYDRTEGNVWISIHSNKEHTCMTIKDDGLGADLTLDELKEDSLGMELIISLTEQLDGKVELITGNGFEYQFEFPILK